jgi:hypothetical protein
MLVTVSDIGKMIIDVRGPVKGKEGILEILNTARELVEQGNYNVNTHYKQESKNSPPEEPSHGYHEAGDY